jgi:hypothetical protein
MVKQLSSNARTITAAKVRFVPATAAPPYVPPHPDSEDKCEAAQQKPALSGLLDRIDGLLVALEHEADRLDERLDCLGGSGPAQIDYGVTDGVTAAVDEAFLPREIKRTAQGKAFFVVEDRPDGMPL